LLTPRPSRKLKDHPLSAVLELLLNVLAANLHIGGRSSIHKLSTRHAVMTGTHLSWTFGYAIFFSTFLVKLMSLKPYFSSRYFNPC
jgi:hypothetical protein